MDETATARAFAAVSLGLGVAEVLAPEKIGEFLGLENRTGVLRAFGFREIAAGLGLLSADRTSRWMWARAGGDALDIALVATALAPQNPRRGRVAVTLGVLAAIMLGDVLVAARLQAQGD